MPGGKNKQPERSLGYTIVEVMIVLAVSGIMFLIAAGFINGKQQRAAFMQGSSDFASKLQGVVEDVTDGHYSDVPLICNASGSTLSFPNGAADQGNNQGCVFLGKLVHFYNAGSSQPDSYQIFSLATARNLPTGVSGTVGIKDIGVYAIPGLTTTAPIPQSLQIKSMRVVDATTGSAVTTGYNIGFTQGLGTIDTDSGTYQSGTQTVGLVYASGLTNALATEGNIAGKVVRPAQSATICLTDGTYYAQTSIGGTNADAATSNNSNQLSISTRQLGRTAC